jgi:hypothetical protein
MLSLVGGERAVLPPVMKGISLIRVFLNTDRRRPVW